MATNKLYVGIVESKVTDKVVFRPELQIISVDQFNRIQDLIKARSTGNKSMGRRGKYIFTGFVVCGVCGGQVVAACKNGNTKKVQYSCIGKRYHNSCKGTTYSQHLILPPIIKFVAELIQNQIDFYTALDDAAARYGKTITEEAIESAIQGELTSVQAGKERIVEAISLGVISTQEAVGKLEELRGQEQRLMVELSSIA